MKYVDSVQWAAWCRMSRYDEMTPAKRAFSQQNDHLFLKKDIMRLGVKQLLRHKKLHSAAWCKINYGEDHPYALQGEIKTKKEAGSQ